jgi:hypothetical protein
VASSSTIDEAMKSTKMCLYSCWLYEGTYRKKKESRKQNCELFFRTVLSAFVFIIVSIVTFVYPRPLPFFYSAAKKHHIFYSFSFVGSFVGGPPPSRGVFAGIHSRSGDLVDILTSSGTFTFLDDLFDSESLFEFRDFRIIRIRSTYSIR